MELLNLLAAHGANINAQDSVSLASLDKIYLKILQFGRTALFLEVEEGNLDAIKWLLEHDADPDIAREVRSEMLNTTPIQPLTLKFCSVLTLATAANAATLPRALSTWPCHGVTSR